ncbi:MAG: hypothetical protein EA382_15205 [Spirochaetaceae bacterium]|nr:MAG: hypothetical protein EA382_15205 [Spirochaetaceae bacterium]
MICNVDTTLLTLLPRIRRARGYRLYTPDGRRLIDCYQDAGRAILGHRAAGLIRDTKAVIERGCLVPLPSPEAHRARQAIVRLLAACDIRVEEAQVGLYATRVDADAALAGAGLAVAGRSPVARDLADPDLPADAGPVVVWRPFVRDRDAIAGRCDAIVPTVPCPSFFSVVPVVFSGRSAPDGALLPEAILRALASSATALVRALGDAPSGPDDAPSGPDDARLHPPDLAGFRAVGPYLWPVATPAERDRPDWYRNRFESFLRAGIVISPDVRCPSIVPGELSDGERKLLERAAGEAASSDEAAEEEG